MLKNYKTTKSSITNYYRMKKSSMEKGTYQYYRVKNK